MWKTSAIESNPEKIKFQILRDEKIISVSEFISGLKDSEEFRAFYNSVLADAAFPAFFWEHKPITFDSLDDAYEFMLVNSEALNNVQSDPHAFAEHFNSQEEVISFSNLYGDAKLIVPCPAKNDSNYTHLGKFVRNSSEKQIDSFWKKVGEEILNSISEKPKG
jgi:hypothetical protein